MKIELTISEIESFIHSYFDIKVGMKYVELNKLEVNYFATLGVSVKEVKEYSVLLGYELNWAMNLLAKG